MTDAEARDEEYRVAWIEHFVASGEFERARELGWDGEAETAVAETAVAETETAVAEAETTVTAPPIDPRKRPFAPKETRC